MTVLDIVYIIDVEHDVLHILRIYIYIYLWEIMVAHPIRQPDQCWWMFSIQIYSNVIYTVNVWFCQMRLSFAIATFQTVPDNSQIQAPPNQRHSPLCPSRSQFLKALTVWCSDVWWLYGVQFAWCCEHSARYCEMYDVTGTMIEHWAYRT